MLKATVAAITLLAGTAAAAGNWVLTSSVLETTLNRAGFSQGGSFMASDGNRYDVSDVQIKSDGRGNFTVNFRAVKAP